MVAVGIHAHVVRTLPSPGCGMEGRPAWARSPLGNSCTPRVTPSTLKRSVSRQAGGLEMENAQKRWENQVRDGRVRNVRAKEVPGLLKDGWTLLDVRPSSELDKARIKGAVEVPLFVVDDDMSPAGLLKQASAFGMGGWWLGGKHMKPYPTFLEEVEAKVPKDASIIVACQKGLRSLAACEVLSRAGYRSLAWINGGYDTAQPGELPVEGDVDVRLAGIGGLSSVLGWTEPQREGQGGGFAGGFQNILKGVAVILLLDVLLFGWELIQASKQ
ncbi:hypothetical protein ACKKBG_A11285 [Auxenochlorella protothecoides x Auxenochlorella symbiontica]